ncbi:hypothetical protein BGX27_009038 [Mortierella sp. AM989]|nr:hypothetical protein BGX27_009038 [Mortierella sp. AM989]
MTTTRGSHAQPQSLAQRLSRSSRASLTSGPHRPIPHSESESEDQDRTPRPHHQTIGLKSSSETLRAKKLANASSNSTPLSTASNTFSSVSSSTAVSNGKSDTRQKSSPNANATDTSFTSKLSLSSKKKRQQREEQQREEQRLKEEANEALRKKHGEYLPPGQSQGQVHTHRTQPQHDHHKLERSRSGNVHFQYQQQRGQRSRSSVRVVSPTPMTALSPSSPVSPSPSPTPSSSSSVYSSHKSGNSWGNSRPTSPTFGMTAISNDYNRAYIGDLKDLDAEGMLSEHWNSNSDSDSDSGEDNRRPEPASNGYSRNKEHQRKPSVETNSSFRTNNSSMVHFDLRPFSPISVASSSRSHANKHPNRSTLSVDTHTNSPSSHQIESDSQMPDRPENGHLEMQEIERSRDNRSWHHRNRSTTGIVTGLSPEFDGPPRPHTSMSRYHSRSKSRDNMADRYLYHSRANSPANSNVPSSSSNHRPHSRHRHHHSYQPDHYATVNGLNDLNASALEELRSKAGSRAAGTIRGGDTTVTGSVEPSTYGTESPTDEHNYLAPLPPFQQGPAYTRVPTRKYCKWFFGGCRWWVLLLLFLILAGVVAAAAVLMIHKFKKCVTIDPETVSPIVYTIDPSSTPNIYLEYQTGTKGTINIVDSPNPTETRVLLKLQRQFSNMKDQSDITGFQIDSLLNGTVHYVLNDMADDNRGFFEPKVACSNSILIIEMPKAASNRTELSFDVLVDQQDVFVNLDESVRRNSNWRFRGISNHKMVIQSLNVNALSISYTSTSPSSVTLGSVIVRDQLSVMSVRGDIQAAVGFSAQSPNSRSTPITVNLNTLDGHIQFDMKAWNQTCSFQVNSPSVQVSKSEFVVLPFGYHNSAGVNINGLLANSSLNGVSGSFTPVKAGGTSTPSTPSGTATATGTGTPTTSNLIPTTSSLRGTYTKSATSTSSRNATATDTLSSSPTPTGPAALPGPTYGAGDSALAAQIMIQANKYVILNFP